MKEKEKGLYTTQLQAGLGVIDETRTLLNLWQPGMTGSALFQHALDSGNFPNVSARRLRNIVSECFAPRYMGPQDYPVFLLKQLEKRLSSKEFSQLLFLFTARANQILADFIKDVYWQHYAGGQEIISNGEAKDFVIQANQSGKTIRPWSEGTIRRVAGYLTGCCADFGLLENGKKIIRKIIPYRLEEKTIAFLAYDLHYSSMGDNAVIAHFDWELFGLQQEDVREELKRLALKGFFIIQTAGKITRIDWKYKSWEDLIHGIAER